MEDCDNPHIPGAGPTQSEITMGILCYGGRTNINLFGKVPIKENFILLQKMYVMSTLGVFSELHVLYNVL